MSTVIHFNPRARVFIRPTLPRSLGSLPTARAPSVVHRLSLALLWLAIASGAIVFSEPAPTDLLMIAAIVLLPIVGLAAFNSTLLVLGAALVTICGFGFISALSASATGKAATHMGITLYLSISAVVLGAFIARNPKKHAPLILNAHLAGALIAATAGLIGYFDLIPGTHELFTKFERASGPFKDPNVFGPYLVLALVYALHIWFNRPFVRGLPSILALVILGFALLLSFSRGAWAGAAIALAIYLYITFVNSTRMLDRFRILALAFASLVALMLVLAAALQFDRVADIFSERASFSQTYDTGHEGRFGGQKKALDVLAEHPFGIGALEFPLHYHHEDVHNVYLSMFLNAGWIGGLLHICVVVVTIVVGFRHSLRRSSTQGYFLVAFAALVATFLQGLLVDTDHWRHAYIMWGIVVALMSADTRVRRTQRIVRDKRPVLLQPILVLPPSRRPPRIKARTYDVIELYPLRQRGLGQFNRKARIVRAIEPRRPVRLLSKQAAQIAQSGTGGNDNLPPFSR